MGSGGFSGVLVGSGEFWVLSYGDLACSGEFWYVLVSSGEFRWFLVGSGGPTKH